MVLDGKIAYDLSLFDGGKWFALGPDVVMRDDPVSSVALPVTDGLSPDTIRYIHESVAASHSRVNLWRNFVWYFWERGRPYSVLSAPANCVTAAQKILAQVGYPSSRAAFSVDELKFVLSGGNDGCNS